MSSTRAEQQQGANAALDGGTRFMLPYPIAALYRLRNSRHEASARIQFSYRLAEGIARFLGLVGLADVAARVTLRERKELFQALHQPGFGKLLALVKKTHGPLAGGSPFLREVPRLDDGWWTAIQALNEARNRFAHDDYHIPDPQARAELPDVELRIHEILRGIGFLREYRLGNFQGVMKAKTGVRAQWYCSRGLEETEPPVNLRLRDQPFERLMTLIDVRDGRALALAPFFAFASCDNEPGEHVMWLQRRIGDGAQKTSERAWVYRHPSERWETTGLLFVPGEAERVDDDTYLKSAEQWPNALALGLGDDALEALRDRKMPGFDERYRVLGPLGVGGMGTVWQAEDTELKRLCALKVIHSHLMTSPDSKARFKREAATLARLDHPRIVRVYSNDRTDDGNDVIVMELCDGESLAARLRREGPLSPEAAEQVVEQILEALAHAHDKGVIHRDIKPDNVMLTETGARVVDFGIAAVEDATHRTRTSQQLGTLGYLAPEYIGGERPTNAVDVYAVARLWLVALTGEPPRTGELRGIERVQPSTAAVIRRASEADPATRFPDAAAMLHALRSTRTLKGSDIRTLSVAAAPTSPKRESNEQTLRSPAEIRSSARPPGGLSITGDAEEPHSLPRLIDETLSTTRESPSFAVSISASQGNSVDTGRTPFDFPSLPAENDRRIARPPTLFAVPFKKIVGVAATLGLAWAVALSLASPTEAKATFEMNIHGAWPAARGDPAPDLSEAAASGFTSKTLIAMTLTTLGETDTGDEHLERLRRNLLFHRTPQNTGVLIPIQSFVGEFTAATEENALVFLQSHMKTFIDSEVDKTTKITQSKLAYLNEQLKKAEETLKKSDEELMDFKRKYLVSPPENKAKSQEFLSELQKSESELSTSIERLKLEVQSASSQGVSRKARAIQQVKDELAELKSQGLGDNHPEVIAVRKRLQRFEAVPDDAVHGRPGDRTIGSLKADISAKTIQLEQVHKQLEVVRAAQASLPDFEARYSELTQSYDSSKRLYDHLLQEKSNTEYTLGLESSAARDRFEIVVPPRVEQQSANKFSAQKIAIGTVGGITAGLLITAFLHLRAMQRRRSAAQAIANPAETHW